MTRFTRFLRLVAAASTMAALAGSTATFADPGSEKTTLSPDGSAPKGQAGVAAPMFSLRGELTPQESALEPWIRATRYQAFMLDKAQLDALLKLAPMEDTPRARTEPLIMVLPTPDGLLQRFSVVESPVMEPGLAIQFPMIKSYLGQGLDDPYATVRFDSSPLGLCAQVLTPSGSWYIDPMTRNDAVLHSAYYKRDLKPRETPLVCHTPDDGGAAARLLPPGDALKDAPRGVHRYAPAKNSKNTPGLIEPGAVDGGTGVDAPVSLDQPTDAGGNPLARSGATRRQYRVAISATPSYTSYFSNNTTTTLANINTAVNRLTGVYENELAVRLVLVANNNLLIFTTANNPYFTAQTNPTTSNTNNQTAVDALIGSANYDIGHCFANNSTAGGLAGAIGNVCQAGQKAKGYSAFTPPINDPFVIDYVSHEMGHQFAGRHIFNNCNNGPGDSATVAYEPGGGTTIMGYAGICGANNLQSNSDAYFNSLNYDQILAYITTSPGNCSTNTATGNTEPTVNAGPAYNIPARTPFYLIATGADADSDPITFNWEQRNGGSTATVTSGAYPDNGTNPLFRSFPAVTSPRRTFPRWSSIISGTSTLGETLPTTTRTLNFRATIRDNRAGGGGVETSDTSVSVSSAAGPFTVTAPAVGASVSGNVTVTWNVASTNTAPINCANVNIRLATDGGASYDSFTTDLGTFPNTGSAVVTFPNIATTTARLLIQGSGNVFFAVNNGNFTVSSALPVAFTFPGPNTIDDTQGTGNASGVADPGEDTIGITVPIRNTGSQQANGVSGTLVSLTPTATVTTASSQYLSLGSGQTRSNLIPYVISLSPSHPCGTPVSLRLDVTAAGGISTSLSFSIPVGTTTTGSPQTFSYTGPAIAIPDNTAAGINATVPVSGLSGAITKVALRFDGSSCNTTATSTTVGLNHNYNGDLVIKLTSPSGTVITLMNRPGIGASGQTTNGTSGHNFCQTILDDTGTTSIQNVLNANAPFTGTFSPSSPLSGFNGQSANGNWTLNVADVAASDTGSLRAFSIIITTSASVCTPANVITGACCDASGACGLLASSACTGAYQGDGTACSPNPCPQPTGTCCIASTGNCSVTTQTNCSGGTWTSGASCTPTNPCPQPLGSCCAASGACTNVTQAACSGTWTIGVTCTPLTCPQPTGSCCVSDGTCSVVTQANCANVWSNGGTCSPNTCPQPMGSCCAENGSCTTTSMTSCPFTFTLGGSCTPNTCPQPITGVCCRGVTCTTGVTSAACVNVVSSGVTIAAAYSTASTACNASGVLGSPCCYANFDRSSDGVQVADIFSFLSAWFAGSPYAVIQSTTNGADPVGAPGVPDIFAFLSAWFAGNCV